MFQKARTRFLELGIEFFEFGTPLLNMSTDRELPKWIETRIDAENFSRDLTQRHVATEFVHGDRPYYNKTKMHAAVGNEVSPDTVKSRLEELDEREVLESEQINNGTIYWLNDDRSNWPIPTDTEVSPIEPEDSELTISEWRQKLYVQTASVSLILAIVGTAITLLGTFQTTGAYSLPFAASEIIGQGLSLGIFSYIGLLLAGVLWIFDVEELPIDGSLSGRL